MIKDTESIRRLGRTAGFLYLVLIVFGMFSPIVLETLVVPGDAPTTADNVLGSLWLFRISLVSWIAIVLADIVMSAVLYLLLEPISRALSLISATFRLAYSALLGAYLLDLFLGFALLTDVMSGAGMGTGDPEFQALLHFESFGTGFLLALVVFGVHLILFGVLLNRSKYVPWVLGTLLAIAGVGYVINSLATFFVPNMGSLLSTVLLTPALFGEVGLTGWLLVKGIDRSHLENPSPVV